MAESEFRITIDPSLRETVKHLAKLRGGTQRDLIETLLRDAMDYRTTHAKVLKILDGFSGQIASTQADIRLIADYVVDGRTTKRDEEK